MKEENEIIIRCLNKYGKVPETYKLLEKIDLLEEEIKRLKEEYIMLQNSSDEYEDKLLKENQRLQFALKNSKLSHKNIIQKSENQKEEIKRLYKQREKLWKRKEFLGKENQRLNNVLNELEKWLKERSGDISFAYQHTLSKLKELKESDK